MTGYTRTWDCRICGEHQDSIDSPKVEVCDTCLRPVAVLLCDEALGVALTTEGVDEQYWMRRANYLVSPLFRRTRTEVAA